MNTLYGSSTLFICYTYFIYLFYLFIYFIYLFYLLILNLFT